MGFIMSMTGFGRSEIINEKYHILAEIKAVNHRYLDLSIKMPRRFNDLESDIRKLVKSYVFRGKTDVFITYESFTMEGKKLRYNKEIAAEYLENIDSIASNFGISGAISAYQLSRFSDVLVMEERIEDRDFWPELSNVIEKACQNLLVQRKLEGENLKADLEGKLSHMSTLLDKIELMYPLEINQYKERLYNKIKESLAGLNSGLDEGRIITEVAIYADRICTDEELVRLKSHVHAAKEKLKVGGVCGKELDFIVQEMLRETNTILSKSNNLQKSDMSIALKTEIEKIREQVQNIE